MTELAIDAVRCDTALAVIQPTCNHSLQVLREIMIALPKYNRFWRLNNAPKRRVFACPLEELGIAQPQPT